MNSDKKKIRNIFNKDFFNFKKNIKDTWNGECSLVYSFWIVYVVYISALAGIAIYLGELLDDSSTFKILFYILFLVLIYILTIIVSVGILRSSSKYIKTKKKKIYNRFGES